MTIPEALPPPPTPEQLPPVASETNPTNALPPEKTPEARGRIYLVIRDNEMLLTKDALVSSNAKQINKFVKKNLNNLSEEQLKFLKSINLQKKSYTRASDLTGFAKNTLLKCDNALMALQTFVLNRGRTDASLVKEVKQKVTNQLKTIALKDLQGKLNQLEILDSLTQLNQLKKELSQVEMKLFDLSKGNKADTGETLALKEQKAKLSNEISELKSTFTEEKKTAMKDFLVATRPSRNDSAEVKAAKKEFQELNKGILSESKALTSISLSDEAQINVSMPHQRTTFSVPTEFGDRANSSHEIKNQGYALRGEDEMTVRKHVGEHFEKAGLETPTYRTLGAAAEFDILTTTPEVSFDQLHFATFNKLMDLSIHKDDANYVAGELNDLVQELPKEIESLDDLKGALVSRVSSNNAKMEAIDRETFEDLIGGGVGGAVPLDLFRAPEYKAIRTAFNNGDWGASEEKEITFTHLDADALANVSNGIDSLFVDPAARLVLEKFLPKP